jgi:D-serine deaminase-like pyridoxal phosphate-dependent protein/AcrR family transcriptional regulator
MTVNPEKPRAVPKGQANADRSEELLQAACRIIARSGARKLSMRDVAEEAGVSKALLHYYFSSRDELLARAYEFADKRGRERVWRDVANVESGAVRLARLFDIYLSEDEKVSEDWMLWSELSSTAIFEPELRPVMEASFDRFFHWIEALVHDAIAEGSLPAEADSRATTLRLIALNDGLGALIARGLIDRGAARRVLKEFLDDEFGRVNDGADGRPGPMATGYLRLLARQMRQAVAELAGLATDESQLEAIAAVSALIDARAAAPAPDLQARFDSAAASRPGLKVFRGQPRDEVPTPHLTVDVERLEANLRSFPAALGGVAFRPHVKSHKSLPIAMRQMAAGAVGIAAAKPSEAEVFWDAGIRNVVIAFPMVGPDKVRRVAEMAGEGVIAVNVESTRGARDLSRAAEAIGSTVAALIEIDTGMGRCGVPVEDRDQLLRLAELVATLPGLDFQGISTYRGLPAGGDPRAAGSEEGHLMVALAEFLDAAGHSASVVAAGSTATAAAVAAVPGISEVRAGVYPFMDATQIAAGTVAADRVALTVIATVVSTSPSGRVTVDAGSKTFGVGGPTACGVFATSMDGRVVLEQLNEEHGIGRLADGAAVEIGERLELVPAFASSAVGTTDTLVVIRGDEVREVWSVAARGARV